MTIQLPSEINPALCDAQCVRLLHGVSVDEIETRIDSGKLIFVFDVSARTARKGRAIVRELRFWFSEIVTPQFTARLSLDDVINRLLPINRKFFLAREVAQLLLISRPTLRRIAREMGAIIRRRTFHVSREAFAAWLRNRWLGRAKS